MLGMQPKNTVKGPSLLLLRASLTTHSTPLAQPPFLANVLRYMFPFFSHVARGVLEVTANACNLMSTQTTVNVGVQTVRDSEKEKIYLQKNIFALFCTQSFHVVALSLSFTL